MNGKIKKVLHTHALSSQLDGQKHEASKDPVSSEFHTLLPLQNYKENILKYIKDCYFMIPPI